MDNMDILVSNTEELDTTRYISVDLLTAWLKIQMMQDKTSKATIKAFAQIMEFVSEKRGLGLEEYEERMDEALQDKAAWMVECVVPLAFKSVIGRQAYKCSECDELLGRNDRYCKACGRRIQGKPVSQEQLETVKTEYEMERRNRKSMNRVMMQREMDDSIKAALQAESDRLEDEARKAVDA